VSKYDNRVITLNSYFIFLKVVALVICGQFCPIQIIIAVIPVKLALYHTVQGLSQQVVSRERESRKIY
jgi:hypothetical protein